jgi:hypothetical protein
MRLERLPALALALCCAAAAAEDRVLGVVLRYQDETSTYSDWWRPLSKILAKHVAFVAEGSGGRHVVKATTHQATLTLLQKRPAGKCIGPTQTAMENAFLAAGIDVGRADRLAIFVPSSTAGCNGGVAGAYSFLRPDGTRKRMPTAISWSMTDRFILHELGHTYGLGHASSVSCGSTVLAPRCTVREYGNTLDTMGNGAIQTFNAYFRQRMGWITPVVHAGGTATYRLGPAYTTGELPNALAIILPAPGDDSPFKVSGQLTLYVEWRKASGFDSPMERRANFGRGAMVNVVGAWRDASPSGRVSQTACAPCLLDMTPGDRDFRNGALLAGSTWTDEYSGATLTVDSIEGNVMTVTVRNR